MSGEQLIGEKPAGRALAIGEGSLLAQPVQKPVFPAVRPTSTMNENVVNESEPAVFEEKINWRKYWHIILERRWLILVVFLVLLAGVLVYLQRAPRIYQSTVRLEIDQPSPNVLNIKGLDTQEFSDEVYLQTQMKRLQSPTLIRGVVRALGWQEKRRPKVEVDLVKSTHLVDVTASHAIPERAMLLANTLAEAFIHTNMVEKMTSVMDAVRWLQSEADTLKKKVQLADQAVQEYKRQHNEVGLDHGDAMILQSLQKNQADLEEARLKAATSQQMLERATRLTRNGEFLTNLLAVGAEPGSGTREINAKFRTPSIAGPGIDTNATGSMPDFARLITVATGTSNPTLSQLLQLLNERESALAGLLTRYRDKYPTVIEVRSQISAIHRAIRAEAEQMLEAMRAEAENAQEKVRLTQGILEDLKRRQLSFNDQKIEFDVLQREADQSKIIYNALLGRMNEMDLLNKLPSNSIKVVEAATVPNSPAKPRIIRDLCLGVGMSMAIALALAFFVNYLDDVVKSQDDVELVLRQRFLGYIPKIRSEPGLDPRLHTHLAPQTLGAEAFRTVRATLALSFDPAHLRVLSVTSTLPDEGKSFVAANLALVHAQANLKTLLVDADFRHPSVHQIFKLGRGRGLSAYLAGQMNGLEEVIHKTDVPNLEVVCAGTLPTRNTELAGSRAMREFLQLVRNRYERIIVDCPPVAAVSDAMIIAAMTDGAIYVTRFGKVRKEQARRALQRMMEARIPIYGVITNFIDFNKDGHYADEYYQTHYYPSEGQPLETASA